MSRQEQLEWLWLAGVLGFGAEHSGELLALYGDAAEVYRARFSEDFSGLLQPAQLVRLQDEAVGPQQYASVLRRCEAKNIRVLCLHDPEYPAGIAALPDAPPVLYCTGNVDVLNRGPFLGMVGSRTPSAYGVQAARLLGGPLAAEGVVIVSGLADGLDGEVHKAALDQNGVTVGVLGCAIDKTYPATHTVMRRRMEDEGAVLSEYGPGTRSYPSFFLQRNRLIAGLSDVLCVLEARQKSGTMSTVHHAQRYGRPVYAVPGSVFSPISEGTNHLLAEGAARPALSAQDLRQALGLSGPEAMQQKQAPKPIAPVEDPMQRQLLDALLQGPLSLEELCARTGQPIGAVLAALTGLELTGAIQALAGGRYQARC